MKGLLVTETPTLRYSPVAGHRTTASQIPAHLKELATSVSRIATSTPEAVHRLEAFRYRVPDFADANELRLAFEEAHNDAKQYALEANDKNAKVIIALAKVQAILSERGEKYEKMRHDAGIGNWTWTSYFLWFRKEFHYDRTLRTAQRKIAELRATHVCNECGKAKGHMPSCPKYKLAIKRSTPNKPLDTWKPSEVEELAIQLAQHVINKMFESAFTIAVNILEKTGSRIATARSSPAPRVA